MGERKGEGTQEVEDRPHPVFISQHASVLLLPVTHSVTFRCGQSQRLLNVAKTTFVSGSQRIKRGRHPPFFSGSTVTIMMEDLLRQTPPGR